MSKESSPSPLPALLGLLLAGPKHPYELYQDFEQDLGRVWHIGQSHFYAYLKQLAGAGLVVVRVEPQPNRPARNIYHLMPAGEAEFQAWLHQPTAHVRHIRLEFLSRLYFYRRLKLPGLPRLVADQKTLFCTRLQAVESAIAESDDEFWRMVLAFRQNEMEAVITWLDRCLQDETE